MDDRYPSTDDHQSMHLDYDYPDAARDMNRWPPLVKWFLAILHYVVLVFLDVAAFVVVIIAWFAILLTGRSPRGMFEFVNGVIRWNNRVTAYAFVLVTAAGAQPTAYLISSSSATTSTRAFLTGVDR